MNECMNEYAFAVTTYECSVKFTYVPKGRTYARISFKYTFFNIRMKSNPISTNPTFCTISLHSCKYSKQFATFVRVENSVKGPYYTVPFFHFWTPFPVSIFLFVWAGKMENGASIVRFRSLLNCLIIHLLLC